MGWWSRTGPVKRAVVVIVGLAVGINVLVASLGAVVGGDPGGPTGSSLATGDDGIAAWSELLTARGIDVEARRVALGDKPDPGPGTVVVADPSAPLGLDALNALQRHAAQGGRIVLVGANASDAMGPLLGFDPGWSTGGTPAVEISGEHPTVVGLERLQGDGRGVFVGADSVDVLARSADGQAVVVASGPVVAVADSTLLWNRYLAEADNAALALALAGPGPVTFAEAEHGFGDAVGLSALPLKWRISALALAAAALVGMWSMGQRFGPPDEIDRPLAPARMAYVDAMSAGMARAPKSMSRSRVAVQSDPSLSGDPRTEPATAGDRT